MDLQDSYLNELISSKQNTVVYLTNGYQLRGKLMKADNFTVTLDTGEKQCMIYKHIISTIEPANKVDIRNFNVQASFPKEVNDIL